MLRLPMAPRRNLADIAACYGFHFHIIDGEPYWDESRAYRFTLQQIEQGIEAPTEELHAMCLDLVGRVVADDALLTQLAIPELYWEAIAASWRRQEPSLYGRMDFAWGGSGPVKLLEYNADTPTSLYESAFFQWLWLADSVAAGRIPAGADQFNSLQEQLIQRFALWRSADPLYFCCCRDSQEDRGTVRYLEDCARQAGLDTRFLHMEEIGLGVGGVFTDLQDRTLRQAFKLYPWEWMMRDDFGPALRGGRTQWLEPLWKSIVSNKGILPLLWRWHRGHPNLLPAYFAEEVQRPGWRLAQEMGAQWRGFVRKPLYSREGANVAMFSDRDGLRCEAMTGGDYAQEAQIWQACAPLPRFGDDYTLIGSWLVGDRAAGIGLREDNSPITKDTSRFVPHFIA
ncbi:glutathionylspermidine synthase family protein [Serratia rhizosphaerae]|uniref:glutathionylspermidine synthase family protein n=1 Tax=Serratia rhizosphaerae TaxID=2597702 RepID=UPI002DB65645|nr:glutathionylspermidine synthase family protein [Serratia rhizosphaerae]MEB6337171.1 glutathionylspermidine synthase family protein [Serratia rhizosphaerae]